MVTQVTESLSDDRSRAVVPEEIDSPRSATEIIDEASDESFPASDPPSHTPVMSAGAHGLKIQEEHEVKCDDEMCDEDTDVSCDSVSNACS